MLGARALSRTLIAAPFLTGGLHAWRNRAELGIDVEPIAEAIGRRLGIAMSGERLVAVTAGVQMVGGGMFALGVYPRAVALILGASLLPSTAVRRSFWADDADPADRAAHVIGNAALVGGLLFAAIDTGGRPSVFWSGRRAAEGLASAVRSGSRSVGSTIVDTTASVLPSVDPH
jgi:uncharacterized membrane protein YphA (DoxX/SURF4 family)